MTYGLSKIHILNCFMSSLWDFEMITYYLSEDLHPRLLYVVPLGLENIYIQPTQITNQKNPEGMTYNRDGRKSIRYRINIFQEPWKGDI